MDAIGSRSLRLLMIATAVVVVATDFGKGDGVWAALAVFVASTVALVRVHCRPTAELAILALLIGASDVLVWLHPNGGGFLGVFVAVCAAALRLPLRWSAALVMLSLALLTTAALLSSERSAAAVTLLDVGVLAFYTMALGVGRLRAANAELEQSRDAQLRAAALGERQRLAREVHDVLAHSLSALLLQLEGTKLLARDLGDDRVGAAIERAHALAKSGLDEARRAIAMLRDEELPGPELIPVLAAAFEQDANVTCTLGVEGAPRELAPEARLAVYRVAQEALTNVRRHAQPTRVELALAYEPSGVRFAVEDFGAGGNGTGNGNGSGGYGLTGMRERAELLGGRLTAAPTASGFRVELWIPA